MHVFGHNLFKAQGFNDKSDIPSHQRYTLPGVNLQVCKTDSIGADKRTVYGLLREQLVW